MRGNHNKCLNCPPTVKIHACACLSTFPATFISIVRGILFISHVIFTFQCLQIGGGGAVHVP